MNQNITNQPPQYPKYTDLSSLDKPRLIAALKEVLRILNALNYKVNSVTAIKQKIIQEEKAAKKIERTLSQKQLMICGGVGAIIFVCTLIYGLNFIIALFGGFLIPAVALAFIIYCLNESFPSQTQKESADKYREEHIVPLQKQKESMEADLARYLQSQEVLWARRTLNERYLRINTINQLLDFIICGRADSMKEALNLYEEVAYRYRMESMQASILTAAQQTAAESAVAAQATLRSAAANEAAAAEARKISQATNATAAEAERIRKASNVTAAASVIAAQDIHKMANRR